MVLSTQRDGLKRDLLVQAGADPRAIRFALDNDRASFDITPSGELVVSEGGCTYMESAPVAWQVDVDGRQLVEARWQVESGGELSIALGTYDPSLPLIIDPTIPRGALFGPTLHEDSAYDVVIAPDGTTYVVGGAWQDAAVRGTLTRDAFVAAFDEDGQLDWLTWFGGTRDNLLAATCTERVNPQDPNSDCKTWQPHPSGLGGADDAIAAAIVGDRLAIVGHTFSTNLPTLNPFISAPPPRPGTDAEGASRWVRAGARQGEWRAGARELPRRGPRRSGRGCRSPR